MRQIDQIYDMYNIYETYICLCMCVSICAVC